MTADRMLKENKWSFMFHFTLNFTIKLNMKFIFVSANYLLQDCVKCFTRILLSHMRYSSEILKMWTGRYRSSVCGIGFL